MTVHPNYSLLVTSGFKFNLANIGKNPIFTQQVMNKPMHHDVEVTRPRHKDNLYDIYTNTLFTVNGFIHRSVYHADRLYVKGAGRTLYRSEHNHMGVINFMELEEELDIIPITSEMLSHEPEYTLFDRCEITLPKDLDGMFLVLAGYIIRLDEQVLKLVSSNVLSLQISKLSFFNMIYELSASTPIFDQLGVEVAENNDALVIREDLIKNESIEKLLTLDNTFIVHIPGKYIDYEEIYLDFTTIPGPYRVSMRPDYPLIGGHGKIIEYLARKTNDSKWTVHTVDSIYDRLIQEYGQKSIQSHLVSDQRLVGNTYGVSNAYQLKMSIEDI